MAMTVGTHTLEGKTIEITRIVSAQGNANGQDTAVYTHTDGRGKPTQEFTMSETVYNAEGWVAS